MYRRLSDMRARDILQNRSCPLVKGAQSIMKAIDEMEDCGLGAVGVESEHKFVGIFTRSDFMKKV